MQTGWSLDSFYLQTLCLCSVVFADSSVTTVTLPTPLVRIISGYWRREVRNGTFNIWFPIMVKTVGSAVTTADQCLWWCSVEGGGAVPGDHSSVPLGPDGHLQWGKPFLWISSISGRCLPVVGVSICTGNRKQMVDEAREGSRSDLQTCDRNAHRLSAWPSLSASSAHSSSTAGTDAPPSSLTAASVWRWTGPSSCCWCCKPTPGTWGSSACCPPADGGRQAGGALLTVRTQLFNLKSLVEKVSDVGGGGWSVPNGTCWLILVFGFVWRWRGWSAWISANRECLASCIHKMMKS